MADFNLACPNRVRDISDGTMPASIPCLLISGPRLGSCELACSCLSVFFNNLLHFNPKNDKSTVVKNNIIYILCNSVASIPCLKVRLMLSI